MTPERAHEIAEVYRIRRADAFVAHVGTQGGIPLPTKNWWEEAILAACYEERHAALTEAAEVCDAKHDEYYERDYYKCAELRMTADEGCRSCEQAILALRDGGG